MRPPLLREITGGEAVMAGNGPLHRALLMAILQGRVPCGQGDS